MEYVCPRCIDEGFEYFNDMPQFQKHCWQMGDTVHQDLRSTDYGTFYPTYIKAMRRSDLSNAPFGLNRSGPRSFHLCFEISYVIQEKVFVPRTKAMRSLL